MKPLLNIEILRNPLVVRESDEVDIPGRLVLGIPNPGTPVYTGTPCGPVASSSAALPDPRCSVPGCNLPGGHRLPHVDAGGNKFMFDRRTEAVIPSEAADAETSVADESADSEMLPRAARSRRSHQCQRNRWATCSRST